MTYRGISVPQTVETATAGQSAGAYFDPDVAGFDPLIKLARSYRKTKDGEPQPEKEVSPVANGRRVPTVEEVTGLSRATVYRLIEKGDFPAGIKLSPNNRAWRLSVLQQWVAEREQAA